jgi:hypothetical protein
VREVLKSIAALRELAFASMRPRQAQQRCVVVAKLFRHVSLELRAVLVKIGANSGRNLIYTFLMAPRLPMRVIPRAFELARQDAASFAYTLQEVVAITNVVRDQRSRPSRHARACGCG